MKEYALVIAGAAAGMGTFWGMASEGFYVGYETTLPRVGWLVGLVWGILAAVSYVLVMTWNLRRGRVAILADRRFRIRKDVLGGMWTGLLCALAVHGTLWMYHLNQRDGSILHGIYWGMLVGVITGALARWIFITWFADPKLIESIEDQIDINAVDETMKEEETVRREDLKKDHNL